ncbi:CD109 antigen-like isoform X1 [Haliotis cracherodii]|uniref:CD109 antigen-like isoform X1 n=1 Tax=Haliotis cracherodii TaxID=6455 RepID=UPI0039EB8565
MLKFFVLVVLLGATFAKDSYVVLSPTSVRPGMDFEVSANILKATAKVNVKAALVKGTQSIASASGVLVQGQPQSITIKVPKDLKSGSYKLKVTGSGGLTFSNETTLSYNHKSMSIFIQTDKAMYKPGQTVHFRAFAMFPDMKLYTGDMNVDIFDPNSNKIKQWVAVKDASGVITNYLPTSSQPVLGDWKIKVTAGTVTEEKVFTIAEYVLPKFEVTVELPSYGLVSDDHITATVKAKYTYGKPVKGTINLEAKLERYYRPWNYHGAEPMITKTMAIDGESKVTLSLADMKKVFPNGLNNQKIEVTANVTEGLTGITLIGSSTVKIYQYATKLSFAPSDPKTFKPGLKYIAYLQVQQQDGRPVQTRTQRVTVSTRVTSQIKQTTTPAFYYPRTTSYTIPDQTFSVPDTGLVPIEVHVPANASSVSLTVKYGKVSTSKSIEKSYSPSDNYIQLLLKSQQLSAGSNVNFDVKVTESISELVYQVMSRGSIVDTGYINKANLASFSIPVTSKMAPNARIIVYYVRKDGEIVTDSVSFDVDGAFENKVSISMDKTTAQPGDSVNVQVTADPQSLVNLLAVDQSVLLLKSGNDITQSEVISELKSYDTIKSVGGGGFGGPIPLGAVARRKRMVLPWGGWWGFPTYYGGSDANQIFKNSGVAVMTDALVYKYVKPYFPVMRPMFMARRQFAPMAMSAQSSPGIMAKSSTISRSAPKLAEVERTRVNFPETWMWTNTTIGLPQMATGSTSVNSEVLVEADHLRQWFQESWCGWTRRLDPCIFCDMLAHGPMPPQTGSVLGSGVAIPQVLGGTGALKEVEHIRSAFPETWLWQNQTTSTDGKAVISTTVPDTITSWVASAFAVNTQSGLGIAPTSAKIRVFRPFFVSLNLPYSVTRGEQLALQAIVFNYLTQDVDAVVSIPQSKDYLNVVIDANGREQTESKDQTQTVHVKAGGATSVYFPIVPATLGKIDLTVSARSTLAADAVKRQLLVEPEGTPKEYNVPVLIDLKQATSFSKNVPITLPQNVVSGSQTARITAIGDLMGPTVSGLDSLLRMPTGCGEQTMLGLAPDVFVTNYLTATKQLTGDIEDKAIKYMESGYQRELTYQHKDGSFSAFGDRDPSGSMWLTAFVIKTFHQAKPYTFIDDDVLTRAVDWMVARQKADGSFPEPGRVIHKDMTGGSNKGASLTAYVLIALLENNDLVGNVQQRIHTATTKALQFLENETPADDYSLAIITYALQLAGSTKTDTSFATLNSHAIVKDGFKYWHRPEVKTTQSTTKYWRPPSTKKAIDIEMTAYALLIFGEKNDFSGGLNIMKWLASQRNPHGGFSSTQDTVLALQALSEFAKMAYSNNFDIQVTVSSGSFRHQFSVNQNNALVLQSVELPSIPSSVNVQATGSGIALVEVAVFFNVEAEVEEPTFDVTVTLLSEDINSITVQTCTRWLSTGASGMAIQELGVPSGFDADLETLTKLKTLKRVETPNKKVVLYFDEIGTTPVCLSVTLQRTGLVAKSQPVPVRVYDYYEPTNQVTAFYQSKLLKNANICSVCVECENCVAKAGR